MAIFDQAYIASYPTIPNRWDVHVGRYGFPTRGWEPLGHEDETLAQILSARGYTSMLIYDPPQLGYHNYDYTRGFDAWWWVRGQHADPYITDPNILTPLPAQRHKLRSVDGLKLYLRNQGSLRHERQYKVARIAQEAVDWLETNHSLDPFFLCVDMWDPHEPFDPPWYDHQLYADPDYEGERIIYPQYGRWDFMSPDELANVRALYAGQVTLVDRWVGRIFDTVEKLGLFQDTLVIWTTDHGHLFGEHNLEGKPGGQLSNLYETTTRIPMMVHHPEGVGEGSTVSGLVQPQDIMPSVLEAIGAPIPPQAEGHSFWPMVDGGAASARRYGFSGRFSPVVGGAARRPAVGHLFDGWAGSERIVESITVTSNEMAMLVGPQGRGSELYDLAGDPVQRRNVAGLRAEEESEMRGAAIEFLREHGATPERITPFTDGIPVAEVDQGMALWAFKDDRERWVAFPTEQQALEVALDREGDETRAVSETTLGALLEADPHSLVHTHGQFYWASDLT